MSKQSEERKQEIEKICVEADEEKATLSKKLKSLSLKCSRKDKVIEVRENGHISVKVLRSRVNLRTCRKEEGGISRHCNSPAILDVL